VGTAGEIRKRTDCEEGVTRNGLKRARTLSSAGSQAAEVEEQAGRMEDCQRDCLGMTVRTRNTAPSLIAGNSIKDCNKKWVHDSHRSADSTT
jgi:hypothetical protein